MQMIGLDVLNLGNAAEFMKPSQGREVGQPNEAVFLTTSSF